jgi:hypothetical protein
MQKAAGYQSQAYQASGQISQLDIVANMYRQQQANYTAKRQDIENLRNVQKARAIGLSTATNAGAQFGSALATEEGAASAQGAFNTKGLSQGLQTGNQLFGVANQQSQLKTAISSYESSAATAQGDAAKWQGIASIGAGLMGASGSIGNLFGGSGGGGGGDGRGGLY